ncbi:MAG: hypothetical protein OEM94_10050 [Acidimicrobiia bacterium]|nr:hypothetical protein [Acidimicrobiia bacterium]MDH3471646.1 hypothetical protein [Acidimicrobiia bacterium]
MNLVTIGLTQLFRGLRRSNPSLAALGAFLLVVGWARRRSNGAGEVLYSGTVKPGKTLEFRMTGV